MNFFKDKRPDIVFYTDIKDMPIHRYMEFQKMLLKEMGVGCTIADYNARNSNIVEYIRAGQTDKALQEWQNKFNTIYNIANNININCMVIAPLIKSINGVEYKGNKDDDHLKALDKLAKSGLTMGDCQEVIDFVKKNFIQNLHVTFLTTHTVQRAKTLHQS